MLYNKNIHHRRSIRLKGYDYSQAGLYFITICVQDRKCLFGEIVDGEMILNDAGKMADNEWVKIPERFTNVQLHEYIVMPNHFHAVMEIVGATLVVAQNTHTNPVAQNTHTNPVAQNTHTNPVAQNTHTNPVAQNETVDPDNETVDNEKGQPQGIAPIAKPKTVGDMVGAFQSIATVEYIRGVKQLGWQTFNGKLWQRNYYEHIIRDEQSYQRISDYIINNPKNWKDDKFYGQ
jgi:putative transposase